MAGRERTPRGNEGGPRAPAEANQRLAGGEAHRDPERLELDGKRPHADSTGRQSIATDDDDGLNAQQYR